MDGEKGYLTVVFEGRLDNHSKGDPLNAETPFGKPVAVREGNRIEVVDAYIHDDEDDAT